MSAPQIEQEARHASAEEQASLAPAPPRELPWRPVLAITVAVLAGAVLWAGLSTPAAAPAADQGENLVDADMAQLQLNREALESAGLAAGGTVYVRDFGVVDGDAVLFNGTRIPLTSKPTPLAVGRGAVELVAAAGSTGCVSVEVGDGAGVYQLCLRDGDPIHTRAH